MAETETTTAVDTNAITQAVQQALMMTMPAVIASTLQANLPATIPTSASVINERGVVGYGDSENPNIQHIPEISEYVSVYMFQTADYILGGANGIANLPLRQLVARDNYLRDWLQNLENQIAAIQPSDDGSDKYDEILRQLAALDLNAIKAQIAHLERHDMNTRLTLQMAGLDPEGYDGIITEPFINGAPMIDQTVVEVTSVVSGDDSINVSSLTNLVQGAYYQLTDGENIEEVQIKEIHVSGDTNRVILTQNVQHQFKDGKAKLYRSSIAIVDGKAYGGGNARTDEWENGYTFSGSNTQTEVSSKVDFTNGSAFTLTGASLNEDGTISIGSPAIGIALVSTGGRVGTWARVNNSGDAYSE